MQECLWRWLFVPWWSLEILEFLGHKRASWDNDVNKLFITSPPPFFWYWDISIKFKQMVRRSSDPSTVSSKLLLIWSPGWIIFSWFDRFCYIEMETYRFVCLLLARPCRKKQQLFELTWGKTTSITHDIRFSFPFTPWSKYMALSPKGRFIQGLYLCHLRLPWCKLYLHDSMCHILPIDTFSTNLLRTNALVSLTQELRNWRDVVAGGGVW